MLAVTGSEKVALPSMPLSPRNGSETVLLAPTIGLIATTAALIGRP